MAYQKPTVQNEDGMTVGSQAAQAGPTPKKASQVQPPAAQQPASKNKTTTQNSDKTTGMSATMRQFYNFDIQKEDEDKVRYRAELSLRYTNVHMESDESTPLKEKLEDQCQMIDTIVEPILSSIEELEPKRDRIKNLLDAAEKEFEQDKKKLDDMTEGRYKLNQPTPETYKNKREEIWDYVKRLDRVMGKLRSAAVELYGARVQVKKLQQQLAVEATKEWMKEAERKVEKWIEQDKKRDEEDEKLRTAKAEAELHKVFNDVYQTVGSMGQEDMERDGPLVIGVLTGLAGDLGDWARAPVPGL